MELKAILSENKVVKKTILLTSIYPMGVVIILAPYCYSAGLFSFEELFSILGNPVILSIAILIAILGGLLQFMTWNKFHKKIEVKNVSKITANDLNKCLNTILLNAVSIIVLQIVVTIVIFFVFLDLEYPQWYYYVVPLMLSFAAMTGPVLFSFIQADTSRYFRTFYKDSKPFYSLSHKMLGLVAAMTIGTVVMLITINNIADKAGEIGRVVPIPMIFTNLGAGVLCVVLELFILSRLKKSIITPIKQLVHVFKLAVEGDFTVNIPVTTSDEVSELAVTANIFFTSFKDIILQMNGATSSLSTNKNSLNSKVHELILSVEQINSNIAQTNDQMSEHNNNVIETSAAVEQLARNINALGENIDNQNKKIDEGGNSVNNMLTANDELEKLTAESKDTVNALVNISNNNMAGLKTMAEKVSDILQSSTMLKDANKLIAKIAARTNMLAMNAAIEAAHAGDAGLGFSVVADEIRTLAETSTQQSRTISESLVFISKSIESLSSVSEDVQDGFVSMMQDIDNVDNMNTKVAEFMVRMGELGSLVSNSLVSMKAMADNVLAGSNEMRIGNQSIVTAVTNMNDISHKVTGAVAEIAQGIDMMNNFTSEVENQNTATDDTIQTLRGIVSRFKIEENMNNLVQL
ncbi:MAG: methyl-accepting chemotaxis protein [Spirochaetales bacterium]|nr:methyl-accepting chemotaxis protein [Spirochaetales bacterium]